MDGSKWRLHACALGLGVLLVPAQLVVIFFPAFNLVEVLLFAGAAAVLSTYFKSGSLWWAAFLCLPVFLLVAHVVFNLLGPDNLLRGIGVGHVVSLVLIPLSTFAGAWYGSRLTRRLSSSH